jgi:predicted Zn-ribbon and HTH transcriptional regulator
MKFYVEKYSDKLIEDFAMATIHSLYNKNKLDNLKVYDVYEEMKSVVNEYYKKGNKLGMVPFECRKEVFKRIGKILYPNSSENVFIMLWTKKYHNKIHYGSVYNRDEVVKEFAERLGFEKCKICYK